MITCFVQGHEVKLKIFFTRLLWTVDVSPLCHNYGEKIKVQVSLSVPRFSNSCLRKSQVICDEKVIRVMKVDIIDKVGVKVKPDTVQLKVSTKILLIFQGIAISKQRHCHI